MNMDKANYTKAIVPLLTKMHTDPIFLLVSSFAM